MEEVRGKCRHVLDAEFEKARSPNGNHRKSLTGKNAAQQSMCVWDDAATEHGTGNKTAVWGWGNTRHQVREKTSNLQKSERRFVQCVANGSRHLNKEKP